MISTEALTDELEALRNLAVLVQELELMHAETRQVGCCACDLIEAAKRYRERFQKKTVDSGKKP